MNGLLQLYDVTPSPMMTALAKEREAILWNRPDVPVRWVRAGNIQCHTKLPEEPTPQPGLLVESAMSADIQIILWDGQSVTARCIRFNNVRFYHVPSRNMYLMEGTPNAKT